MELTKNQKLWIEALRSGKYKQTKHALEDDGSFCCLGVACKVAEEHGVALHYLVNTGDVAGGDLELQIPVRDWLGLVNSDGCPRYYRGLNRVDRNKHTLIYLNDDYDKSFEEIADIIEEHPEWYFVNEENNNETV